MQLADVCTRSGPSLQHRILISSSSDKVSNTDHADTRNIFETCDQPRILLPSS